MITIKKPEEIALLREGGAILWHILLDLKGRVKTGVTTKELEERAMALLKEKNAEGAFLNYEKFPSVLCASVNDMIVHGVPDDTALKDGDIVGLDLGVRWKGLYTDAALTACVGTVSKEARRLVAAAETGLMAGLARVRDGARVGDIGAAVEAVAQKEGFAVVKELVGHGVGYRVHEEPSIPNYGRAGEGEVLRAGMVLAIEPMLTNGGWRIARASDGFGFRTKDGSLSSHAERTIAVTNGGYEMLTA